MLLHITTTTTSKQNSKDSQIAHEEEGTKKKPKFLTCKEAIYRIIWDTDLQDAYSHLSMVYKDRFEGDTLISYEEFLNSDLVEELPQHRIQQFIYREEFIFWDKRERIDMLSNGKLSQVIKEYLRKEEQEREDEQAQFTTILQTTEPSSQSKKQTSKKKNKKIMSEFLRAQDKQDSNLSNSDSDSELDRYMDEYDEKFTQYFNY